jgi:hypothetical protein
MSIRLVWFTAEPYGWEKWAREHKNDFSQLKAPCDNWFILNWFFISSRVITWWSLASFTLDQINQIELEKLQWMRSIEKLRAWIKICGDRWLNFFDIRGICLDYMSHNLRNNLMKFDY